MDWRAVDERVIGVASGAVIAQPSNATKTYYA